MKNEATDASYAAVAQKIALGGGGAALFGGLSASDVAAIGGLLIAIISVLIQLHYKHKEARLAAAIARKRYGVSDDD